MLNQIRSDGLPKPATAASQVTPLILTFNEEPNLRRTLSALSWANEVVILDSGSTDATIEIAKSFSNVRVVERPFDAHGRQWEFGVRNTGIVSEYVLALDADMELSADFVMELDRRFLPGAFAGGVVRFQMIYEKRTLAGGIYPAQLRVFRRDAVLVTQRGHTQVFQTGGKTYSFKARIRHEDRKPFSRWIVAQLKYADLEFKRIDHSVHSSWRDRLRQVGLMPIVVGTLSYVRAGGPLRGRASLRYALERTVFECLLALQLIERKSAFEDPPKQ